MPGEFIFPKHSEQRQIDFVTRVTNRKLLSVRFVTTMDLWVEVGNKNNVEKRSGSRLLLSGLFLFVRIPKRIRYARAKIPKKYGTLAWPCCACSPHMVRYTQNYGTLTWPCCACPAYRARAKNSEKQHYGTFFSSATGRSDWIFFEQLMKSTMISLVEAEKDWFQRRRNT